MNKVQFVIHEFGSEICDILPSAEACQKWLKDFHDGLVYRKVGRSAFADKLIAEAKNFIAERSACGKLGGRPRKAPPSPPGLPELYAYVAANDLDEAYAREWYDMCVARGWKDRDGNPIQKWRGALTNYVKARVANAIAAAVKEAK